MLCYVYVKRKNAHIYRNKPYVVCTNVRIPHVIKINILEYHKALIVLQCNMQNSESIVFLYL